MVSPQWRKAVLDHVSSSKWGLGSLENPVATAGLFSAVSTCPSCPPLQPRLLNPAPFSLAWPLARTVTPPPPRYRPSTGLPTIVSHVTGMLRACCKHVRACFRHGHFHLAACATQVRWRVAWASPTLCLAVELSGRGAWLPSHSLSLERN